MPCEKSLCSSKLNYFINSSLIHFTENELKFLTQWQRRQLSTLNWHLSVSSIHENILSFPISTLCCWLQKEPPSSFSAREQNSSLWSIYFQIARPTYQSIKCIITFLSGSKTRLTFAPCTFFPPQNKTAIFHTETCIWWCWVSKARSSHTRAHARIRVYEVNKSVCLWFSQASFMGSSTCSAGRYLGSSCFSSMGEDAGESGTYSPSVMALECGLPSPASSSSASLPAESWSNLDSVTSKVRISHRKTVWNNSIQL